MLHSNFNTNHLRVDTNSRQISIPEPMSAGIRTFSGKKKKKKSSGKGIKKGKKLSINTDLLQETNMLKMMEYHNRKSRQPHSDNALKIHNKLSQQESVQKYQKQMTENGVEINDDMLKIMQECMDTMMKQQTTNQGSIKPVNQPLGVQNQLQNWTLQIKKDNNNHITTENTASIKGSPFRYFEKFTKLFTPRGKKEKNSDKKTQDELLEDLEVPFQKYWINTNSPWYLRWTLFILLLNLTWIQAFLPIRMSFEDQRSIMLTIAIADMCVDFIYILETISIFFIPKINKDGEYVFDRKLIAKEYLKRWFFIDCLGNIPFSIFKAYPGKPSLDDFNNFIHFNFAYIPRFYIFCMALKLFRIRNVQKYLLVHMKRARITVNKMNLILTCWTLILILHMIACFWGVAGTFNFSSNVNWIYSQNMQDSDVIYSYITSLYWASVTIITVGYGDIIPQNDWETALVCCILVIGVAMFSYTLSALANQFSDLSRSRSKRQNRDKQMYELQHKYKLSNSLMEEINYYFQQSESVISISRDYEMNSLLKVLPPNLKTRLALFLYHDAITAIPFLQNRGQMFYLNYLDQLVPLRFQKKTVLLKKGTRPEEIFFVLKGFVENQTTKRALGMGSMIGETDYVYRRERADSYVALTDVFILKYDIQIFDEMMQLFDDIRDDVESIAKKREKMRLTIMRQSTLIEEQEKHKKVIFQNLQVSLKKEREEMKNEKDKRRLSKNISKDNSSLDKSSILQINLKDITERTFFSDQDSRLNTSKDPHKSGREAVNKLKNKQLERIDETHESRLSFQKTISDHEDIFRSANQKKSSSTFQLQNVQDRIKNRKQGLNKPDNIKVIEGVSNSISTKKFHEDIFKSPFKELNKNQKESNNRHKEFMNTQSVFSSSGSENIEKIDDPYQIKLSLVGNNEKIKQQKSNSPDQKANLHYSPAKLMQSPSFPKSEIEVKKISNYDVMDLYESDTSKNNKVFLQNQDAFLYSNPDMKLQTLKFKVYNENDIDTVKNSNLNNNSKDNQKRIQKIYSIIKKSKLILNEYGHIFANYMDKINLNNQNTVSAHIIHPTKQAIKGIQKYNQVLSFLELKLEQPKLILDNIDNIENMIQPQIDLQQKLKDKIVKAMLDANKRQAKQKFEDKIKQLLQPVNQITNNNNLNQIQEKMPSMAITQRGINELSVLNDRSIDNSFRQNQLNYDERSYLKAEQSFYEDNTIKTHNKFTTKYSPIPNQEQSLNTNNDIPLKKEQLLNVATNLKNYMNSLYTDYFGGGKDKKDIYGIQQKDRRKDYQQSYEQKKFDNTLNLKLKPVQPHGTDINNNSKYSRNQDEYNFTKIVDQNPYQNQKLQLGNQQHIESRTTLQNPSPYEDNKDDNNSLQLPLPQQNNQINLSFRPAGYYRSSNQTNNNISSFQLARQFDTQNQNRDNYQNSFEPKQHIINSQPTNRIFQSPHRNESGELTKKIRDLKAKQLDLKLNKQYAVAEQNQNPFQIKSVLLRNQHGMDHSRYNDESNINKNNIYNNDEENGQQKSNFYNLYQKEENRGARMHQNIYQDYNMQY